MSGVQPPGASAGSAAPAEPSEQAAQDDDDSQPRGYVISGGCGHRRTLWANGHVDPCECDLGGT